MHAHALIYSSAIQNTAELDYFRKEVFCEPLTILNLNKHAKKAIDYMNSIVYVNDTIDDRDEYLQKDKEIWDKFEPVYYKCGKCSEVSERSELAKPIAYQKQLKRQMKSIDQIQQLFSSDPF